jgi:hypothetical protein
MADRQRGRWPFAARFGPGVGGREDQLNVACRDIDCRTNVSQRLAAVASELAGAA